MTIGAAAIIGKLWNYCNILRDDGLSYGDYVEQLTYLLFLKMAEEHSKPPFLHLAPLPKGFDWASLISKKDEEQLEHYERILRRLGNRKDLFGSIYKNALSKFRDPGKFQLLVGEINTIAWSNIESDVKGDAYEGLLEKTAAEGKAGAGQYFTPRALVEAIVKVVNPRPGQTICDPACGTGGFLLSAYRHLSMQRLTSKQRDHLVHESIHGVELVDGVARLCLMNLVLHGIGGHVSPIQIADSLENKPAQKYDIVLANPPFGKKSTISITTDTGIESEHFLTIQRDDFWASTRNKQLNFLQHIYTLLNKEAKAAVIVPDNVLFEGGAGETVRRELLKYTNLHTLLRLPTGIFYAQGVKANVLFFDKGRSHEFPCTEALWVYDLRTNLHFTLKERPLSSSDLKDFVSLYCTDDVKLRQEGDRFRRFTYTDIMKRDKANLDIVWLQDDTVSNAALLPPAHVIAQEITEDLESIIEQLGLLTEDLAQASQLKRQC